MNDKVYTYIFNEIFDNILQLSENPSQFASYLSQQIREIIGVKVIVISSINEQGEVAIFSVFPERKRDWANNPSLQKLIHTSINIEQIQYFDQNNENSEISSIIKTLEIEKSIFIPLTVSNKKVGSILLMDIMDLFGVDAVIELLSKLSGVFALVIRNSMLYSNLEETVATRTQLLNKRNQELLDRELRLELANKKLEENLLRTQELNIKLKEATKKALESDRLKTAFLQNMSHEIRTPMNAIMGFSKILPDQFNNKQKLEKFTQIIGQRCNDLLDIINDILDISKIESGQLSVNIEDCNINQLFSELTLFFFEYQKRLGKQDIQFSLKSQSNNSDLIILTDKVKLKQIFINLINNAFKFTKNGKIEGGCFFNDQQKLTFFLKDTGVGIPNDKLTTIYNRFTQLQNHPDKIVAGTGLGLSIVKGLVNLLGGEIEVSSELGIGTTFTFTINYKTSSQPQIAEPDLSENQKYNFKNKTILIVEDDAFITEYIKEILSETNAKIIHAEYGLKSVELVRTNKIDLVLMDIRLPDINGYEATEQIKSIQKDLKIIIHTAYASNEEKVKAMNRGCTAYISKPAQPKELLELINRYI